MPHDSGEFRSEQISTHGVDVSLVTNYGLADSGHEGFVVFMIFVAALIAKFYTAFWITCDLSRNIGVISQVLRKSWYLRAEELNREVGVKFIPMEGGSNHGNKIQSENAMFFELSDKKMEE